MKRKPPLVIYRKRTAASRYGPCAQPLNAVITCLDSARTTGVATYVRGRLHDYREVQAREPAERLAVLRDHVTVAYLRQLPHAVVLEVPWGGQLNAALSLEATAALWRDTWRQIDQPRHLMLERTSNDWRRQLSGSGRALPREQARQLEMVRARAVVGKDWVGDDEPPELGSDAAAAICIGQVMVRSTELRIVTGCDLVDDAITGGTMPRTKGRQRP